MLSSFCPLYSPCTACSMAGQPVPRGLYTGAVRLRRLPTGRKRTPPSVRLAIVFTILPYQSQL